MIASSVSCGGHSATTCAECPQGHGESWCNNDCEWDFSSSTCVTATFLPTVSCGNHKATTCAECPQGNGESWCNGECYWDSSSSTCVTMTSVSCGNHKARICAECPQGNGESWCNGECKWQPSSSTCIDATARTCANGKVSIAGCDSCPYGAEECSDDNGDCTWISRSATCRDTFSNEIRTASVQLNYDTPISVERPAWFFQRVSPVSISNVTYFASNGHGYGYGGFQKVNATHGSVIFSLWDQGGCDQDFGECDSENIATTVACGKEVTCTDFGGEGTGRKSILWTNDSLPVVGESYYMMTQAEYLGNKRMQYTGYFYDPIISKTWRLMSRIEVSTNDKEKWWIHGMFSFVEQWAAVNTTIERSALFGPGYVSADGINFVPIQKARYTHGIKENHEHVNAWQTGQDTLNAVGIATGGNVEPVAKNYQSFKYNATSVAIYDELQSFIKKIPCLKNATNDAESIEKCLWRCTGGKLNFLVTAFSTLLSSKEELNNRFHEIRRRFLNKTTKIPFFGK